MVAKSTGTDRLTVNIIISAAERMWRGFFINWLAAQLTSRESGQSIIDTPLQTSTNWIRLGCYFVGRDIVIGAGTCVNYRCFFDGSAPIRIGRKCGIGMEVLFCTTTHIIGPASERAGHVSQSPTPNPSRSGTAAGSGHAQSFCRA